MARKRCILHNSNLIRTHQKGSVKAVKWVSILDILGGNNLIRRHQTCSNLVHPTTHFICIIM